MLSPFGIQKTKYGALECRTGPPPYERLASAAEAALGTSIAAARIASTDPAQRATLNIIPITPIPFGGPPGRSVFARPYPTKGAFAKQTHAAF